MADPHEGVRLESVDPGGVIADNLPIERVIASVVYPAAEIERPGVIRHIEGNRFSLAELDGSKSERILRVSEAFAKAGFKAPVVSDVRSEIWTKLWGNLSFNPISALTHATLEDICRFAPTRALAAAMMAEAQAVGEALGIRFRIPLEKRIAGAEAVGAPQDVDAPGRRGGAGDRGRRSDWLGGRTRPDGRPRHASYGRDLRRDETSRRNAGPRKGPPRHHAGVRRRRKWNACWE